jgi:hypothetical protein
VDDIDAVKARLGVPDDARSCHTAQIGDYVLEGHVPTEAIERMLAERPAVTGISAPGMPGGAPGMAEPGREGGYDVVTFTAEGVQDLYERR